VLCTVSRFAGKCDWTFYSGSFCSLDPQTSVSVCVRSRIVGGAVRQVLMNTGIVAHARGLHPHRKIEDPALVNSPSTGQFPGEPP